MLESQNVIGVSLVQVSMLKHEGMISVYRGFIPTLLGIMPYASISFFTFETSKQQFRVSMAFNEAD